MLSRLRNGAARALRAPRQPPTITPALWCVTRAALWPVLHVALRGRVVGRHHIPRHGAVLVVCNHVSIADPPAVLVSLAARRRAWTMTKAELYRIRPLAWWMSRCGAFPVNRFTADRQAIRTARNLLAGGECVLVFGEGRVTRSGMLGPGVPGMGHLALLEGVTVIPAVVWNTQLFRGPVRVRFGAPVPMGELRTGRRAGRNQAAADRVMNAVAALLPLVGGPVQPGPRAAGRG